jgi:hypothetical protein
MIPSTTIAMMARITAPNRPKINQPIRNATTAPNPIAPQFTDTIFHHLLFTISSFPLPQIFVTGKKEFPCMSDGGGASIFRLVIPDTMQTYLQRVSRH